MATSVPQNESLPLGFSPTPEESSLLQLYLTVKSYEKESSKLKEKAAKDKLREAEEKYRRDLEKKNNPSAEGLPEGISGHKKKRRPKSGDGMDAYDEGSDEYGSGDEEVIDSGDDGDGLPKLTKEETEAKQAEEEEKARDMHLKEADGFDVGPVLKRKRLENDSSSLLVNIEGSATPPREFSKKLAFTRGSNAGTIVFPKIGAKADSWSPPPSAASPSEDAFEIELKDFDASRASIGRGNNTIAIKFMAPSESNRFSINIAGPGNHEFSDILFHFNPRQRQKGGQLVVNDKQEGMWGQGLSVPLANMPYIFGEDSCTLVIQVTGDGFDVFIEGRHVVRLEHRTQLPPGKTSLFLQFPSTDDYSSPEIWSVYKIWWGSKPFMANEHSRVPGVKIRSGLNQKKLFISGLSKIVSDLEVEFRIAELETAFGKYGGKEGVTVTAPINQTFAFVEVESERQADLALKEMSHDYRLDRAKKSRQEAMNEEKAARAAKVEAQESEWD